MMIEEIKYGKDVKELLKEGVDTLVNAVKITLGPKGRNVIISENGVPHVTKDGVTVAKSIIIKDPYKNLGAELVKQAALKTVFEVGDSTTQTCILAQSIIDSCMQLDPSLNPTDIKSGMDYAVELIIQYLNSKSIPIEKSHEVAIEDIAKISANNDEKLGADIAQIFMQIGLEGVVRVESSEYKNTEISISKGMKIDRGFFSPVFINVPEKESVIFENCVIYIANGKVNTLKEIIHALETAREEDRPILIIAEDYDHSVLSSLSLNNAKGNIKVCAIKSPGFGDRKEELLQDIRVFTEPKNSNRMFADKVIVTVDSTIIMGGAGQSQRISERVSLLEKTLQNSKVDADKENLKKRIAGLIGGIATIYVGASTEVEMLELKDRYDDAISAVTAAIRGGISVGGGVSYVHANYHLSLFNISTLSKDAQVGFNIIKKSILEPFMQIQRNAGITPSISENRQFPIGFNAKTMQWENLMDSGIIDPTKSIIAAIQNATSVASMFLTADCAIILNE